MKNLETYDFEMFSKAGNVACRSVVNKAINKINGAKRITQEEITQYCKDLIGKVAEKHGEVEDTEPGWHIAEHINKALSDVGYQFKVSRYDIL
jgi:hypothetical protein